MKKYLLAILLAFLIQEAAFSQDAEGINIRFENRKKSGYFFSTQIGMLMGNREITEPTYFYGVRDYSLSSALSSCLIYPTYPQSGGTRIEMQYSPSITMTHGYMFNEHWSAGIGVGIEMFSWNFFPLFADLRYTLWDDRISPFFSVKSGYAFGNFKKKHYDQLKLDYAPFLVRNIDFRNYGGFLLNPEMGVKFPLSEKADLLVTVAYRHQKAKTKIETKLSNTGVGHGSDFEEWEHNLTMNRLSFGIAFIFR